MSENEVLAVNAAFYRAMRIGDYLAMEAIWSHDPRVTCTHPSGPAIHGRAAVLETWRMILCEGVPPAIRHADPTVIVTGNSAMVLCSEFVDGVQLMASNAFRREGRRWRMINHQAAAVPGKVRGG